MSRVLALIGLLLHTGLARAEPPVFAAFDAASEAILGNPHDLVLGPDGRLYVSDLQNSRIAILDPDSLALVGEVGGDTLSGPHDVDFDGAGRMLVADTNNGRIAIFERGGEAWQEVGSLNGLSRPEGVTAGSEGVIYATSAGSGAVVAFRNGEVVARAGGLWSPHDVVIDADGNVWVADTGNQRLVKFSPALEKLSIMDDAAFGFRGPRYLDIDAAGALVVADKDAHRIIRIGMDGSVQGVLGGERGRGPNQFTTPEGVETIGGRYYFSDSGNNRIVRYLVVTN